MSDELLAKYLSGEASGSEQEQVQNWIKESEMNKKQFEQVSLIWSLSRIPHFTSNVNEDEAWARFRQNVEVRPRRISVSRSFSSFNWMKVAAVLLLLVGGGLIAYMRMAPNDNRLLSSKPSTVLPSLKGPTLETAKPDLQPSMVASKDTITEPKENLIAKRPKAGNTNTPIASTKERVVGIKKKNSVKAAASADEVVCNGTPCPIEICIIQTVQCKNKKLSQISTCSTIEPDQSGQLRYKAMNMFGKNCGSNVQEIRITRVSTGETIVLNEHSSPVTAQDLFGYITGQKKGDVVAGMFHTDCNNFDHEHRLKFDNNYGDLIVQ